MSTPAKQARRERTHYDVLSIKPSATTAEIQRRYKRLALELHPDRNPGRESVVKAQFQDVVAAYNILSDAVRREAYDAKLNINFTGRVQTLHTRTQNIASTAAARAAEAMSSRAEAERVAEQAAADERAGGGDAAGDDDDDDEDEEYVPGYDPTSKRPEESVIVDAATSQFLVEFDLDRPDASAPLGVRLDKATMRVKGTVDDTPAQVAKLPTGAVVHFANGVDVAAPADIGPAVEGCTKVVFTARCDVQRISVPRAELAPLPAGLESLEATADEAVKPFAPSSRARVQVVEASSSGGASLAPGDATGALVLSELGGPWQSVLGRRIVAVGGEALTSSSPRLRAGQLEPSAAEDDMLPGALAARRTAVELLVVCDTTTVASAATEAPGEDNEGPQS